MTKYERKIKHKLNLIALTKIDTNCYYCVARRKRHGNKYFYVRTYRGSRSKYLKQLSNRRIRRYKGDIKNGYACHKMFDFWWELD